MVNIINKKNLDLQKRIGQMMMVGWQTNNADDIVDIIKEYHFGNIILFSRNIVDIAQLKDLCAKIQDAAIKHNGATAFIGIDQEGGSVKRIFEGITEVPGAMAIAASSDKFGNAAYDIGSIVAKELKDIGINFNIAPVVDINTNPYNPIIGIRAYSDTPHTVSRLASLTARGYQENGIMACYKHFLGHGSVKNDTHLSWSVVDKTLEELERVELVPYINNVASSVMTAHIKYSQIDNQDIVTISREVVTGLLREKLRYQGIIISDCFEMNGLQKFVPIKQAGTLSVNAGIDIIMVSHTLEKQIEVQQGIMESLEQSKLDNRIINRAVDRIIQHKRVYCNTNFNRHPIELKKHKSIASEISKASISMMGSIKIDKDTVIVGVKNQINTQVENQVDNIDVACSIGNALEIEYLSINVEDIDILQIRDFVKDKKVLLALSDSHIDLRQEILYNELIKQDSDTTLISMRTPYDVLDRIKPKCHICTYEYTELAITSLIEVLKTGISYGVVPVTIQ